MKGTKALYVLYANAPVPNFIAYSSLEIAPGIDAAEQQTSEAIQMGALMQKKSLRNAVCTICG